MSSPTKFICDTHQGYCQGKLWEGGSCPNYNIQKAHGRIILEFMSVSINLF